MSTLVPIYETNGSINESTDPIMRSRDPQIKSGKLLIGVHSGIGEALFPKIRRKVLALFMLNPDRRFYFREVVRILGDSPGSAQRELKSLEAAGILNMETIGIQKFYNANRESPVYDELRSIAAKTFGIVDVLRDVFRRHADSIELAWVHGSVASGEDTSHSDIDLIVIGTVSFRELASIVQPLEISLRRQINPSLFPREEFASKYRSENHFVRTVMTADKLFIAGDQDELDRMVQE